jgi:hypothetical protein
MKLTAPFYNFANAAKKVLKHIQGLNISRLFRPINEVWLEPNIGLTKDFESNMIFKCGSVGCIAVSNK